MQGSLLTQILLPLLLATIMFGMGLGLTGADFKRLITLPRAVAAGLLGQLLGLPLLALLVILLFDLDTALAVGLMLVALCPGGTSSNLICQLARANLALSISLTAISNLICMVTAPLALGLTLAWLAPQASSEFSLVQTGLGLLLFSLLPVLLGMLLRRFFEDWAITMEPKFRMLSQWGLIVLVIAICIQEWQLLRSMALELILACLLFNASAVLLGIGLGKLMRLPAAEAGTVAIEVGLQNTTLAMLIAINFIGQPDFAITAGLYGLVMYLGAAALVWRQQRLRQQQVQATPL
ncbi:bile acid:sodium symporter family protein [Ferrimonas senticii]|uniref:bile acid:sodium symporter family protein n=1 Tax=Ferrimonas senticii TaxID=394566 RepID=UPI0004272411|nr:bile acid:sodium symporter [Ferrimonas senticii]